MQEKTYLCQDLATDQGTVPLWHLALFGGDTPACGDRFDVSERSEDPPFDHAYCGDCWATTR